jgi:elongation factor 2
MDPIMRLARSIMDGNKETTAKLIEALEIKVKQQEMQALEGKQLLKYIMSHWIGAADVILEMMVLHLPSPKQAQKYRAGYLYEGP